MIKKTAQSQSGFTLLEVAVILSIVTMLLGFYLSFYKPAHEANAMMETTQKIDRVLNALARFAMTTNNRLPCPGNPTSTGGNLGVEDTGGGVCGAPGTPGMGIVPYRTLGLSQEDARDGFGRFMTYIVDRDAATNSGMAANKNAGFFCTTRSSPATNPSDITLFRNNVPVTAADRPVAVVMSHGPTGLGSYDMGNTNNWARNNPYGAAELLAQLGGTATTGERGNIVNATIGTTSGRLDIDTYDTRPGSAHFDDIIGYMTGSDVPARLSLAGCIP